jgi:hypothetical protein
MNSKTKRVISEALEINPHEMSFEKRKAMINETQKFLPNTMSSLDMRGKIINHFLQGLNDQERTLLISELITEAEKESR